MNLVVSDQTKKYLCIIFNESILRCFKLNSQKNTPMGVGAFRNQFIHSMDIRSCKNISKKSTIHSSISFYICLTLNSKEIQIIHTLKKNHINIRLNFCIESVLLSDCQIFVLSNKILFVFDINSGEIIKKIQCRYFFKSHGTNKSLIMKTSKKSKYISIQKNFLITISVAFGFVVQFLKNNYKKIILMNFFKFYIIILLFDSNLIRILNFKKKTYKNLNFFYSKRLSNIYYFEKIFLKNDIILSLFSVSFLSFGFLGIYPHTVRFILGLFLVIKLHKTIQSVCFLNDSRVLLMVFNYKKKTIPVKIIPIKSNPKPKEKNAPCYKVNFITRFQNFLLKKINKSCQNFFLKKNVKYIDIKFKIIGRFIFQTEEHRMICEKNFVFFSKFKQIEIFVEKSTRLCKNYILKILKNSKKFFILPLFIFVVKKILLLSLNKTNYLLWIKQICFFYFYCMPCNDYVTYNLNTILNLSYNTMMQKVLQNLLVKLSISNLEQKHNQIDLPAKNLRHITIFL